MRSEDLIHLRQYFTTYKHKLWELERARMSLYGKAVTYDGVSVQTSPCDSMLEIMTLLIDEEKAVVKEYRMMTELKEEALAIIYKMPDKKLANLLGYYYINGRSWSYTASKIGETKSKTFYTLKRAAMQMFDMLT